MLGNAVTAKIAAQAALITRQQIELDAWRSGRLWWLGTVLTTGTDYMVGEDKFPTIEDAVDALMAEREESNA